MNNSINSKQILGAILTLAILFLTYNFLYKPLRNDIKVLNEQKANLSQQLTGLENLQGGETKLANEKKSIIDSENEFLRDFPKNIKEEKVILDFMNMVNNTPGLKIQVISLTQPETSASFTEPNTMMRVQVTGSGKYDVIKRFLNNIKNNRPKLFAENLNMTAAQPLPNPDINFTMQLTFLAYNGQNDQEYPKLDKSFEDMDIYKYDSKGSKTKSNIFEPAVQGGAVSSITALNIVRQNPSQQQGESDFYVVLSPALCDSPGVSACKADDGNKTVRNPVNGLTKVEFVIDLRNGQYFYKYKVGDRSYPADYANTEKFVPVDISGINLKILGNNIMAAKDNVAAEVSIINNTNLAVNVQVQSIAQDSGKLKIIKTKGLINETWN